MNEQRARELFLDQHRGSLSPGETAELRAFLDAHPELQREFDGFARTLGALDAMPFPAPTPRLRASVFAAIEEEKRAGRAPTSLKERRPAAAQRSRWFWLGRAIAGCLLLGLGFLVGIRRASESEPRQTTAVLAPAAQRELADLRRQVDSMSQLVSYSLLQQQQQPTNDRLKTVLASARLENPNGKIINELIGSLALDPSANVRLTALEALYPHAEQDVVRAGVLASLPREQSPLVQVAMIDFLVAAREHGAAPALDRISRSDTAERNVRDAAKRALNQL
jgi:anti-sigma factor RsiW